MTEEKLWCQLFTLMAGDYFVIVVAVVMKGDTENSNKVNQVNRFTLTLKESYGVFFSTKKCALYFKKWNFVFVSEKCFAL